MASQDAAQELADEYLDSLACELESELERSLRDHPHSFYISFDTEGWKKDVLISDGYMHMLSTYDGNSYELVLYNVNSEGPSAWFDLWREG